MKQPIGVTCLLIFVLFDDIINLLRLCEAIFFWKVLEKYHASPLYLAITGGIWLIVSSGLIFGIWSKKKWAWAGSIVWLCCFAAWYWFDRLVVEIPHANWPFTLFWTFLILGISAIILFNHKTRDYFNLLEMRN
jgi:hypothetical protein